MPVFHRIEVNIVTVALEIAVVTQRVLPKSPLPDSTLTFAGAAERAPLAGRNMFREFRFDQPPPCREIRISQR